MQGSEAVVPVLSPSPVSVVRRQDTRMTKHTCAPPDTQAAAEIPASLRSAHDDAFEGRVAFLPSRHELSNYARAFCLIRTLSRAYLSSRDESSPSISHITAKGSHERKINEECFPLWTPARKPRSYAVA